MIPPHHRGVRRHAFSGWTWTPFVGTLIAVIELWIAVTHVSDPWISIMLATISATSAMLGPGAFSIDAVLFGRDTWTCRKQINPLTPQKATFWIDVGR